MKYSSYLGSYDLGNFIAATAGPHLESIIAGKGAGSARYSQDLLTRVINIDIGGGTSNFAVFHQGEVEDTACIQVGGRLIEVDSEEVVQKIHAPAQLVIRSLLPGFQERLSRLTHEDLHLIAGKMADLIVECLQGNPSELAQALLLTDTVHSPQEEAALTFSGGVGECYYQPESWQHRPFQFGDIGPLLAEALSQHPYFTRRTVLRPQQTIRATVIGAGAQSLSLSGSTIWVDSQSLPLRNVPVVHPKPDWQIPQPAIEEALETAVKQYDLNPRQALYAVYLPREMPVQYRTIVAVVEELARYFQRYAENSSPVLVLCYHDIGKVLGMELAPKIKPCQLAIIDEVRLRDGDYVDVGKSLFGGEILPLTIKSLAFPS